MSCTDFGRAGDSSLVEPTLGGGYHDKAIKPRRL